MELSVARGTFNVSATSTRDPKDLLDDVAAVLTANGVAHTPSETFGFHCHKVRTLLTSRVHTNYLNDYYYYFSRDIHSCDVHGVLF
jgi:hypothetical protein